MKLDDFEARAIATQTAPPPPAPVQGEVIPDDAIEETEDEQWAQAMDYLKQASYMLGFFSDKILSGPVTQADRERMGNLAGSIMEYVCSFNSEV